ncbi:MAG TPA: hypothetical protein VFH78_06395 [Candidatus Thermoplasmatota archaeon]|nr:hypothetical protein [Candidatus Thermoplasmatota archaeon]
MHPWLGAWLPWLVLAHVLSAFLFVLFHAPAAWAMWRLRREREPARVAALLDLSQDAMPFSWTAFLALGLSGLAVAAAEHTWREPWVWGSALLLVLTALAMSALAARPFNEARSALGLRWFDGRRVLPAAGALDEEALAAALARVRARAAPTALVGLGSLVALVWLMLARPG